MWASTSGYNKYVKEVEKLNDKLNKANDKLKSLENRILSNQTLPYKSDKMYESYEYMSPTFIDIIKYSLKNYPYINRELNDLLNRYNNGETLDYLLQEFKDIISNYDTIVFDTNGDPILEDSTDIDLAMLLINI